MTPLAAIGLVLALASSPAFAAQLYRWVDERGNVEWRDTPPPSTAKHVEQRNVTGNTIETSTLPFSVQQAVKNHPVTLWTADCGEPCTQARAHLARRGIPHVVRDARKETEVLKKTTGALEIPVLLVGSTQFRGYLENAWDTALDNAGYPRTSPVGMKPPPTGKGSAAASRPSGGVDQSTSGTK